MYIWAGCKLPEGYSEYVRSICNDLNQDIGLDTAAFSLPQHVSLKISFFTDDEKAQTVLDFLAAFLSEQAPFSLTVTEAEQLEGILWLRIAENTRLQFLHEQLDSLLEARFQIPQHPLDRCFVFHSTLFQDSRTEKIGEMLQKLQGISFSQTLPIDTLLLGVSTDGTPGTCKIVREIKIF